MEDGAFKSGAIKIGDGVTLGVGAFVHYDVEMGDKSMLDADAFLMKGARTPAGTIWRGNPANPSYTKETAEAEPPQRIGQVAETSTPDLVPIDAVARGVVV